MGARLGVLAAVVGLWGCGSSNEPVRLSLGDPCVPGDALAICSTGLCVALDDQSGFCTAQCTDTCEAGFLCQAAGRYGRICRPLTGCQADVDCPAGHTCAPATGNCYIKVSRALCSPCQDTAQCPAGGACFTAVGSQEQFCTAPCGAADACPAGYACEEIPAGPEGAMNKQCVPAAHTCSAGKALCAACRGDSECGGPYDLCVRNVVSGELFCGRDCNPAKNVCPASLPGCAPATLDSAENPDCPAGFSCTNLGKSDDPNVVGPFQCTPNSNTCAGYCDATTESGQVSQCGLGQVCVGHACQPASDGRECSPCSDNDDCRRGGFAENRCLVNNCPDCPFQGETFCATSCLDTAACVRTFGPGFLCAPVTDPTGAVSSYCMPQRGTCKSGLRRLGEDCSVAGAQDCVTGLCVSEGLAAFCTQACTADVDCGDLRYRCCDSWAAGYDCGPAHHTGTGPASGVGICAPTGGLFGDDCSPGRPPCQSGTCLDLGTARLCTEPCPSGACPADFTCRPAETTDGATRLQVCFPNGGGQAGANCSFGPAACESGLCIRKDTGNLCTVGCQTAGDCPPDWACELLRTVTDSSVQACLPPALQEG